MIKFYVKIPANLTTNGKKKQYLPYVAGYRFDDMPFDTATEAQNMGLDLIKQMIKDPDVIFEWEEKYGDNVAETEVS